MADYMQKEFDAVLLNLEESIAAAKSALELSPISQVTLIEARSDLLELHSYMEKLRPKTQAKVPYDFGLAAPSLVAAKRLLVRLANGIPTTNPPNNQDIPVQPPSHHNEWHLPPPKIIPFAGDPTKLSSFEAAFNIAYGTRNISGAEKLLYLVQHLTGEPASLIANLAITAENYDKAIQILHDNYAKADQIISHLYLRIEHVKTASDDPASLNTVHIEIEGLLAALATHGENVANNPLLRTKVLAKYPMNIVQVVCHDTVPPLLQFQARMRQHIQMRMEIGAASGSVPEKFLSSHTNLPKATTAALLTAGDQTNVRRLSKKPRACIFCSGDHYNSDCTKFPTIVERRPLIQKRCYLCLSTEHDKTQCNRDITCYYCKKSKIHNSALCPQKFGTKKQHSLMATSNTSSDTPTVAPSNTPQTTNTKPPVSSPVNPGITKKSVNLAQTEKGSHITVLLTVRNVAANISTNLRAVLDCGSDSSYITESAARMLNLTSRNHRTAEIDVFAHEVPTQVKIATVPIQITNNQGIEIDILADTIPSFPTGIEAFDVDEFRKAHPEYETYKYADPALNTKVDLLIGNDHLFDLLTDTPKIRVQTGLHMVETIFGWILAGRIPRSNQTYTNLFSATNSALSALWSLEKLGISDANLTQLEEEEQALEQFYKDIKFIENRYEIRWPFRQFPPPISSNFNQAFGHLKTQLRRFNGKDRLLLEYDNILKKQLEMGIIEEVPETKPEHEFYLPHHPVIEPEKTTAIRIVYNGSVSVGKNKQNLNQLLYKGKNLLTDIPGILIRARLYPVLTSSDIEKAFHMLRIAPEDRDYVRFLWIKNLDLPLDRENLRILRFQRVAFGIVSSPFLLAATIRYHLQQNENRYTSQILRDLYVDNIITGFSDSESALDFYETTVKLFEQCSMNLRSWTSNDREVQRKLPGHHRNPSHTVSVLGIIWDSSTDTFSLKKMKKTTLPSTTTLRNILKFSAQLFDPCGWFTPITIRSKILMQKIRRLDLEFDDHVPDDISLQWNDLFNDLNTITSQTIPRYLSSANSYQIHAFADASASAYACVLYLREDSPNGIHTNLVFAKARVAPTLALSIPKLELMAVWMAARVLRFVRRSLPNQPSETTIWTDSKCVLSWIMNEKILPTFVQNRVNDIRESHDIHFRYVPTDQNPADIPSRGTTYNELGESIWWRGPDFLQNEENFWPAPVLPRSYELDLLEEDIPATAILVTGTRKDTNSIIDLRNFSSYLKLLRILSNVIQFISNFSLVKQRNFFTNSTFLIQAEQLLIKGEQRTHFAAAYEALQTKKKNDLVNRLCLFLDDKNIIRCAGRFANAPLPPSEKSPILLPEPKYSWFTHLVILHFHQLNFHVGTAHTLTAIRRKFWIPRGRRGVFHTLQKCQQCKRFTSRPYKQPTVSNLPPFRMTSNETPFTHIGIDVFGHLFVQNQKRWVLLTTCLNTRAIHLEELLNMTAPELALAFRRTTARYTRPKTILSDNAPQYDSLRTTLQNTYQHDWTWKDITEYAPWEGGAYERLVQIAKRSLQKTFHGSALSESHFRTALVEIAATLNSRPLTYVTEEGKPLTPNDLLNVQFQVDEKDIDETTATTPAAQKLVTLWKQSREILDKFWSQWKTEYFHFLRERRENYNFPSRTSTSEPKIDDVVIIYSPNLKRSVWQLGRIVELHPSSDRQVRSATVRIASGRHLVRPISFLYPIETSAPENSQQSAELDNDHANSTHDDDEVIELELDLEF